MRSASVFLVGWNSMAATDDSKERIRYDGNGNILGYLRLGTTADGGALQMDSLTIILPQNQTTGLVKKYSLL
jgi:hypothetical protein